MRKLIILAFPVLFFGCATLDKEVINNPEIKVVPDNLELGMDYDPYKLRVDLVRMKKPDEEIDENTPYENTFELYHNIGVRLSNGIFLDYNGNLTLDLMEFYNLDKDPFRIVKRKAGGVRDYIFSRDGEDFSMVHKGVVNTSEKVLFMEDMKRAKVSSAFFGTGMDIIWTDKRILADSLGINSKLDSAGAFKVSDVEYRMSAPWNRNSFVRVTNKRIEYGDELLITLEDKLISIRYSGLFDMNRTYYFFRTENGFYFYDKDFQGVRAEKEGDVISVYKNKTLQYRVTIEK